MQETMKQILKTFLYSQYIAHFNNAVNTVSERGQKFFNICLNH